MTTDTVRLAAAHGTGQLPASSCLIWVKHGPAGRYSEQVLFLGQWIGHRLRRASDWGTLAGAQKSATPVEAKLNSRDIGLLHAGLPIEVKLTVHDFVIHGGLEAQVEHIGADIFLRTMASLNTRSGYAPRNRPWCLTAGRSRARPE